MNKKIKIAIGIISLILITGFLIYPLYINNSVENTIKNYYETRDKHKNIDEYNSLVVSKSKLENLDSIPDIVEKREFLDIKEINPEDYELIKSDLERGIYSDKEKKYKFYMIKYDIKFKDGVTTPVDSGVYYAVQVLENVSGRWLINGGIYNASFKEGKLFIED